MIQIITRDVYNLNSNKIWANYYLQKNEKNFCQGDPYVLVDIQNVETCLQGQGEEKIHLWTFEH